MVDFEFEYFENQEDYLKQMQQRCDCLIVGQYFRYVDGYNYDRFNNDEDIFITSNASILYDALLVINLNGLRYGKLLYQEDQYAYLTREFFTIDQT